MGNKKKRTGATKWNRVHFFKRQKSNNNRVGHPVLVYGRNKRAFKFLLFTHNPPKGKDDPDFHLLEMNIDPDEQTEKSYVKKQFQTSRQSDFEEPIKKYRIHELDKETIKKYKK